MLTTCVQVAVSFDLDSENSEQQKRTEGILLKQLEGQQQFFEQQDRNEKMLIKQLTDQKRLMEQQMRDGAAMRKAIATLQASRPLAALKEKPRP